MTKPASSWQHKHANTPEDSEPVRRRHRAHAAYAPKDSPSVWKENSSGWRYLPSSSRQESTSSTSLRSQREANREPQLSSHTILVQEMPSFPKRRRSFFHQASFREREEVKEAEKLYFTRGTGEQNRNKFYLRGEGFDTFRTTWYSPFSSSSRV